MPVQDDARENELINLFELIKPDDEGRSGMDAYMILDGRRIPFELKSTTTGSVTTVRDFGPDHIRKWVGKHWLIGVYNLRQNLQNTIYGSPEMMEPWIKEKAEYIALDIKLADLVPDLINMNVLNTVMPIKQRYTLEDAKKIQKKQHKISEYRDMMDLENGYSPTQMLEILRARCIYLIKRGSTLNNPHIPESYFAGNQWSRITRNHKLELERLVRETVLR